MENIYNVAIPEPKTEGKVLAVKDGQWQLGDSIPASSSADSGKVLTVGSDGKPGWANASGGASGLLVTATDDGDTTTLDKTYEEIVAALGNGILPLVRMYDAFTNMYSYDTVYSTRVDPENDDRYVEVLVADGSLMLFQEVDGVLTHTAE